MREFDGNGKSSNYSTNKNRDNSQNYDILVRIHRVLFKFALTTYYAAHHLSFLPLSRLPLPGRSGLLYLHISYFNYLS